MWRTQSYAAVASDRYLGVSIYHSAEFWRGVWALTQGIRTDACVRGTGTFACSYAYPTSSPPPTLHTTCSGRDKVETQTKVQYRDMTYV